MQFAVNTRTFLLLLQRRTSEDWDGTDSEKYRLGVLPVNEYDSGTCDRLAVSEQNVIVLKALHIAIRAILVLASAFWLLILMELLPPLMVSGLDGARGKLVHIWTMDRTSFFAPCENSLQILHEGYTDVIVFLLITWTAVEVNRILRRLIVANAEAKQSSQ